MSTNDSPPPRQFWAKCAACGQYRISEETARQFLTVKLQQRLDDALAKGALGAVLIFKDGCPNCKPDNTNATIELVALKKLRVN